MTTMTLAVPGPRKAAMFLMGLGDQIGRDVLRHLSSEEVRRLMLEIAATRVVGADQLLAVFHEFEALTNEGRLFAKGGTDRARRMAEDAFGKDTAEDILAPVLAPQPPPVSPDILEQAEPKQLALFLKGERPQTIAVVLTNLSPERAADLLKSFPEDLQTEVALRMAALDRIAPEVFLNVAAVIGGKLKSTKQVTKADGVRALANLLNHVDNPEALLARLDEHNRPVADSVRSLFFVFEDVLKISKEGMKALVAGLDRSVFMLALKGARPDIRSHFTQGMSQRASEMLVEDMEAMGPVKIRDVKNAQKEVLRAVRNLQQAGTISLETSGGEQYVV